MFHERASSFNYRHLRCTGDSNSRQHGKKSPSLTTRPGLPTLNQLSFGQRNFSGNGLIEFRLMAGVDVPTKINVRKRVFLIFREKSFFLEKVKIGFFVNSRECHLCSNLRKRERKLRSKSFSVTTLHQTTFTLKTDRQYDVRRYIADSL